MELGRGFHDRLGSGRWEERRWIFDDFYFYLFIYYLFIFIYLKKNSLLVIKTPPKSFHCN